MNNINVENKTDPNPPVVSNDILSPVIQEISQQEISGLYYTGITVNIKLPLQINSGTPLFAINTDGFIPIFNLPETPIWAAQYANLMPVQSFEQTHDFIEIEHQPIPNLIQQRYLSNRFVDGAVGVVLRIVSNVGQTGHFSISRGTGIMRQYYHPTEKYDGLKFLNYPMNTFNSTGTGMVAFDISTNRNLRITTVNNDPSNRLDMAQKFFRVTNLPDTTDKWEQVVLANQFQEDWFIIGALTSVSNTNGDAFKISVYFDYSRVTFALPMFQIIPTVPINHEFQIFKFSNAFNGKVINSVTRTEYADWLPGTPPSKQMRNLTKHLLSLKFN